jgi:Uma2 family endonuclease
MSARLPTDPGQPLPMVLSPDLRPSIEHLVTEDDTPKEIYSEKQQRLLTSPLYSSWPGPGDQRPFVALANVGMFYTLNLPPLVPDCLLSLDVRVGDLRFKKNRSYFIWEFGKVPEVVLEVVSNLEGEELGQKLGQYARIGIPYYVVWDPFHFLGPNPLHVFGLRIKAYEPLATPWFPEVDLGLTIWHGSFEGSEEDWLRWCDANGQVILTGEERAQREGQRAKAAEERAQIAEQRAETAERRAERLAARLRELGIEPDNLTSSTPTGGRG